MSVRVGAVVAAAGGGRRMGGRMKAFMELAGEPMLARALRPFLDHPSVRWVVVAVPAEVVSAPPAWLAALAGRVTVVAGGRERGDSVRRALAELPAEAEVVLVHDAARPLVTGEVIERVVERAATGVGAVAAVPVTDTLKEVTADGAIVGTPDRRRYWRAQTPQGFPRRTLEDAYRRAEAEGIDATDDAALVERFGGTVFVVAGSTENLKITEPADLVLAEALLRQAAGREDTDTEKHEKNGR